MLSLLLFMKNTFAPISRIPPEIFSLIPDYWGHWHAERDILALTHVCHGWREIFTSRPSLWTHLDCRNADKTRVYIERSKTLPLKISLSEFHNTRYCDYALSMATPSLSRSDSLTISVSSPDTLVNLLDKLPFSGILKEVEIRLLDSVSDDYVFIPSTIFPGHLSPLRKLTLSGVTTYLPWRNLSNLLVFEFDRGDFVDFEQFSMTGLLDFFESAPLLRKIAFRNLILDSFTISPGRVVSLPNLERFAADPFPPRSTFFDHLSIPTGASLSLDFSFPEGNHPIPVCVASGFNDLHITTINLLAPFPLKGCMRLDGPSGRLRTYGGWRGWNESAFFQSLCKFNLSNARRLSVTAYTPQPRRKIEDSPIFQPLLSMNSLRTLALIETDNMPFIHALNPAENESHAILCPALENLVLYRGRFAVEDLEKMVSERAKRFFKLSSITIVGLGEVAYPAEVVLSLREHVSHVEYKLEVLPPKWDAVFGENKDDCNDD